MILPGSEGGGGGARTLVEVRRRKRSATRTSIESVHTCIVSQQVPSPRPAGHHGKARGGREGDDHTLEWMGYFQGSNTMFFYLSIKTNLTVINVCLSPKRKEERKGYFFCFLSFSSSLFHP